MLVNVGNDRFDFFGAVTKLRQGSGHRLIDNGHVAATYELLEFHKSEVGLDARGVTVHQESNGAGGCEDRGLRVTYAVLLTKLYGLVPGVLRCFQEFCRHLRAVDLVRSVAVHAKHVQHWLFVFVESRVGSHATGRASAGRVRVSGHQSRNGGRPRSSLVGVVSETRGHQQRTNVRVAHTELTELS